MGETANFPKVGNTRRGSGPPRPWRGCRGSAPAKIEFKPFKGVKMTSPGILTPETWNYLKENVPLNFQN